MPNCQEDGRSLDTDALQLSVYRYFSLSHIPSPLNIVRKPEEASVSAADASGTAELFRCQNVIGERENFWAPRGLPRRV